MKCNFPNWRRLLCCLIGLVVCGFGVALSTRPDLGTSPISSLPYACSVILPWGFGVWTILVNLLFILGQLLILRKEFHWTRLSQVLAVTIFGFCIDMGMLVADLWVPEAYAFRILEQLLGCFLLAVGISLQLIADVSYMPGDGLVKVISDHWHLRYGSVKVIFDSSLVVTALCVALAFTHHVQGLGEGTVIAALCTGNIIKALHCPMQNIKAWLK